MTEPKWTSRTTSATAADRAPLNVTDVRRRARLAEPMSACFGRELLILATAGSCPRLGLARGGPPSRTPVAGAESR